MTIKSKYSDRLEFLKSIKPFSDSFPASVLDSYYHIIAGSLVEIKETFSNAEVNALTESFQIKEVDEYFPDLDRTTHIISMLDFANNKKNICQKHGISFEKLEAKLLDLTTAQAHVLTIEILVFLAKYPNWKENPADIEYLHRSLLTKEIVRKPKP